LSRSRDLRALPYLGAAVLRTDGMADFLALLDVARSWLQEYRDQVHPKLEPDFNPRSNALGAWSDPWAILDGVRRAPFLESTAAGDISLRTWFIAHGDAKPVDDDDRKLPAAAELEAALGAVPDEEFEAVLAAVTQALDTLSQIESLSVGIEPKAKPASLDGIAKVLTQIQVVLGAEAKVRVQRPKPEVSVSGTSASAVKASTERDSGAGASSPRSSDGPLGEIRSREDAVRCLAAVRQFFARTEPSSPIPLLIDRTQRLIDKSFLDVLEELIPDSVKNAKEAVGVKSES
jgi:type VI secretion system protein ImpA